MRKESRDRGRGGPKPRPERVSVPRGLGGDVADRAPQQHSRPTTPRADGTESILTKKAAGFRDLIETCGGSAGAQNMLITEQLPNIVREQVNAISNLKIDKVTVWDGGKNADGKTGTAEVGANREFTQPWFICFAPVDNPRIALAVTVERTTGQGGTVAAPIAKSVLEALLGGGAG